MTSDKKKYFNYSLFHDFQSFASANNILKDSNFSPQNFNESCRKGLKSTSLIQHNTGKERKSIIYNFEVFYRMLVHFINKNYWNLWKSLYKIDVATFHWITIKILLSLHEIHFKYFIFIHEKRSKKYVYFLEMSFQKFEMMRVLQT